MALSVKRFPVRQKRVKYWQRNVRKAFDSFACELLVIMLVILYALIIFADLAYTAARDNQAPEWDEAMRHCDIVLLSIFMVEICLRIFGFGLDYLRDCINVVDAVVVLVSWVITLLPPSVVSLLAWFRLFRIMRLFRFAIIKLFCDQAEGILLLWWLFYLFFLHWTEAFLTLHFNYF